MSDEQPSEPSAEQPVEAPFIDAQSGEAHHGKRQPQDPRSRLRELLAIPERDRTDALWDEIIGLEIDMAPGNRASSSPQGDNGRRQDPGKRQDQGRRPDQARRQDPARAKPGKRFFQKRKRGPGGPPERS
jgi:hypothetical protein